VSDNRTSFLKRFIYSSIIIVVASLIVTIATLHYVTSDIIRKKAYEMNKVLTDAAADKANAILEDIANIINLSVNNRELDELVDYNDDLNYDYLMKNKDYETYLKRIIMNYDELDALLIINENLTLAACNTVLQNYDIYKGKDYYNKVLSSMGDIGKNRFFLETETGKENGRVVIISPIFKPYSNSVQALTVAVLSKRVSQELNFAHNDINISDQCGNKVTLYSHNNNNSSSKLPNNLIKRDLVFDGWTIQNSISNHLISIYINNNIKISTIFSIVYICIAIIFVLEVGKKVIMPLKQLNEQVKIYSHDNINATNPLLINKARVNFKTKLMIFYSAIISFPIIFITVIFYINSTHIIKNEVGSVYDYETLLLSNQLDTILNKYYRVTKEIITDNDFQDFFTLDKSYQMEQDSQNKISQAILISQMRTKAIINVSVYNKNFELLFSSTNNRNYMTRPYILNELEYIRQNYGQPLWMKINDNEVRGNYYRIGMQIRGINNDNKSAQLLGYILLDFDANQITEILNGLNKNNNIKTYLLDDNGSNLFSFDDDNKWRELLLNIKSNSNFNGISSSIDYHKEKYLITYQKLTVNKWRVISAIGLQDYLEGNKELFKYSIALLCFILSLGVLSAYGFSQKLNKNISKLISVVREVRNGNLNARFITNTIDEISELGESFNEMLQRLKAYMDEKIMSEIKIKDAEIRAKENELSLLQSQINPHFLYNTLKTVQYMAHVKDDRAEKMVKLLIFLFKYGSNIKDKLVKIEDEVRYIDTYLEIQKIRFSNKFKVKYNISDELLDYSILKLTLQPIVENSIYHGLELIMNEGQISIEGKLIGDIIQFKISDNGVGIKSAELEILREQLKGQATSKSIGIINVHERIQLYFGNQYGISISSEKNAGTEVKILIPAVR
jgi:two-component system, sensor histidine kinase YesM